jgi:hypothetical protein
VTISLTPILPSPLLYTPRPWVLAHPRSYRRRAVDSTLSVRSNGATCSARADAVTVLQALQGASIVVWVLVMMYRSVSCG